MFEANLARVVSQVGASGAAVVGLDGLTIDAVDSTGQSVPAEEATREYASVFKQLTGVADSMEVGAVTDFTVEGREETVIVRMLSAQYFAVLRIPNEVPAGKGRFYLRVVAPDIVREL